MRQRRIDHPRLQDALAEIERSIDFAWLQLCDEMSVGTRSSDHQTLAKIVMQDPSEFLWRAVDGALRQLWCPTCRAHLGSGLIGCLSCDFASGLRFAGKEIDRADAMPGSEHALRVSSAVALNRHRYSKRVRCGYELILPDLLRGSVPTTSEAQSLRARINAVPDDVLEFLIEPRDLH
jgi:hypothetical protein